MAEPERIDASHGIKPVEHLPLHLKRHPKARQHGRSPRSGAYHQALRLVGAACGPDAHAPRGFLPRQRRLLEVQVRTMRGRPVEVSLHGRLRADEPRRPLEEGDRPGRRLECRETAPDVGRGQFLVRQSIQSRTPQTARHHGARGLAHHQPTYLVQQIDPRLASKLAPQLIRSEQQRDVGRVLVVALPDHPRAPVTRSAVMGRGITLQP